MDAGEVKRALELIHPDGGLFEIRCITSRGSASGYFTDPGKAASAVNSVREGNVYFVLNQIKDACYSREQRDRMVNKPKQTTSDGDIARRRWLLIDVDSERASGVSATEDEKAEAREIANRVYLFLKAQGFAEPVCCDSGNGAHLLYRIDLDNSPESRDLVHDVLDVLDMFHSTDRAKIDTSVFNASRITKLYGTVARKGSDTPERPHRASRITRIPDPLETTPEGKLRAIAALKPQPPVTASRHAGEKFDLRGWLRRYGLAVSREEAYNGGTKLVLEKCPFDENHKGKDAVVFENADGAIAFHCFHNSCQGYHWQDLRRKFEPDAYDPRPANQPKEKRQHQEPVLIDPRTPVGNRFLKPSQIKRKDRSEMVSICSGIRMLDKRIIGFNKGEMSIWSGGNGSGKSSLLSQLAIETVEHGYKAAIFSGEMQDYRTLDWLHLQAAGRRHTMLTQFANYYTVPHAVRGKINAWLDDSLYIYDNNFGAKVEEVLAAVQDCIEACKVDVVILDNLMSLDLSGMGGEKYDRQTALVLNLAAFAKKHNVHIHFVCHPRKAMGFLRKNDISGTADITNAADNVFIVHRVNTDFKLMTQKDLKLKADSELYNFSNVIEICKNRDLGVADEFIGLYFERSSKRLMNDPDEDKRYGWEADSGGFVDISEDLIPDMEDAL